MFGPARTSTSRLVARCAGSFAELASALKKTGPKVDWIEGAGNCLGYATPDDKGHLSPFKFERRPVGDDDVGIAVTHCGICHSDLHQIKNEWGNSMFPMVPVSSLSLAPVQPDQHALKQEDTALCRIHVVQSNHTERPLRCLDALLLARCHHRHLGLDLCG